MEFLKLSTSWLCRPEDVQVLSVPVPYQCLPAARESSSGWVSALTRPREELQAEPRADPQTVRAAAGEAWKDSRRREVSWTFKCLLNGCDQRAIVLTQGNVMCCINRCMFHLLLWIMKFKPHLSGELSSRWMGQEPYQFFPSVQWPAVGAGVSNQYLECSVWKGKGWVGSVLGPGTVCFGIQGRDALKQVWNLL